MSWLFTSSGGVFAPDGGAGGADDQGQARIGGQVSGPCEDAGAAQRCLTVNGEGLRAAGRMRGAGHGRAGASRRSCSPAAAPPSRVAFSAAPASHARICSVPTRSVTLSYGSFR